MPLITLSTDFGDQDYYVGAMKGVLLSVAPSVTLVDLSHHLPMRSPAAAAHVLRHAAAEFPPGTVHLAVVDPGVGTARRPIVVAALGYLWVGPDNGLLGFAAASPNACTRLLAHSGLRRSTVSPTFHGRDVFAPAAARLALGFPFVEAGPEVNDAVQVPEPAVHDDGSRRCGQVIHVDTFGNLVTNLDRQVLPADLSAVRIWVRGHGEVRGARTYGDVEPGQPVALIGSCGRLEIAVAGGSAASALGLGVGAEVALTAVPAAPSTQPIKKV
jgi:S-adenosylmethionine hydrolase